MKAHSPAKGPSYHFSTDIPEFYEDTLLRIVPCNPHQRYVYWEIPADIRNRCVSLLLRVCQVNSASAEDTTSTSEAITEYPLDAKSTHHYVTLSYPTLEYQFDLLAVFSDSSKEVICSTQSMYRHQKKNASVSDVIVFRSTAIETDETSVASIEHQPVTSDQSATTSREVPVVPSSWSGGSSHSS